MVPRDEVTIIEELGRFETAAASAITQYDVEHSGPAHARGCYPRIQLALMCVVFLATDTVFGIMLPTGGRSAGASRFPDSSWKHLIVVSFAQFALAVLTQLVRAVPIRPGIPPRKDLAWLPVGLGVPGQLRVLPRSTGPAKTQSRAHPSGRQR